MAVWGRAQTIKSACDNKAPSPGGQAPPWLWSSAGDDWRDKAIIILSMSFHPVRMIAQTRLSSFQCHSSHSSWGNTPWAHDPGEHLCLWVTVGHDFKQIYWYTSHAKQTCSVQGGAWACPCEGVGRCEGLSIFFSFSLHLHGGTRHWNWAQGIKGGIQEFALFHPLSVLVSAHISSGRRADEIRAVSVVSGSKVNFIKSKAPLTAISRKESKALFITGISIEAFVWPPYRLSPPHPHWLQIRDGRRVLIK